ncbi:MAG: GNAT family N-acetyltransferase [Salinivirgaceae bacterium]|jgi:L-amino acid N-acyltransferase YncA|nr:GNAT family N-acetyltransferase [Salinivirgaceae bacterium]
MATFHLENITLDQMVSSLPLNHNVYKTFTILFNNEFCGYCCLNNWKPRQAYDRLVELTLYIKPQFHGKGVGKQTLIFLEQVAIKANLMNFLGVITLENTASVKLFEKMGCRRQGLFVNNPG